ncbi:restriction endonuclease subunit S [Gracilimonas halophila]|uniref:Type I restriction enzyme, S subunit n=1 Tax=Gracilimonas halophila TaxID=1834464 RepID=A0ABW5JI53_9BACT
MIVHFNTAFSKIGNQKYLKPSVGYRHFFDKKDAVVTNAHNTIPLKKVLFECERTTFKKGELEEEFNLVDLENIEKRLNSLYDVQKVDKIGSNKYKIGKGDIIISKIQPRNGDIYLLGTNEEFLCSTELIEYKISKKYYPLFFYYLITLPEVLAELEKLESGKTHRRVSKYDLLQVRIPLVNYDQQLECAELVNDKQKEIFDLKKQLKDTRDTIDKIFTREYGFDFEKVNRLSRGLDQKTNFSRFANDELKFDISLKYRAAFDSVIKPINFKWIPLDKVLKVKGGKRLPKGHELANHDTGIYYVRVDDLDWTGKFNIENIQFINEETRKIIKKYIADKDDLLITIVGATVGKCGIVPEELSGHNITENFAKLVIRNKKLYDPKYILYCLQSSLVQLQILEFTGRASQGKLALFRIKKIRIPDLNISRQRELVEEIDEEFEKQNSIRNDISRLRDEIDEIMRGYIK